jgi:lysozyme
MTPRSLAAIAAIAGAAGLALWWARSQQTDTAPDALDAPTIADELQATAAEAINLISPTPASEMDPSPDLLNMLKAGEGLRLQRYRLGDGGWTIGYGRYFPDSGTPPPESIDLATAEQWFADDVEVKGARWVRAYVNTDVTQNQFDALVSMAFNLRPKAFKTIAAAVNNGDDPEEAAMKYSGQGKTYQRGLTARRGREIALYRDGTYTA